MPKKYLAVVATIGAIFTIAGCGSSSNSSTSSSSEISNAVPGDVVISSPTASTAVSASLSTKAVGDPTADDLVSKREALQALISGDSECSFTLSIPTVNAPDCYGPTVRYAGHPDAVAPQSADGEAPVNDVGMWSERESTEACSAAMMNSLVDTVAARVDNIMKMVGSMACAGKKTDATLPAAVGGTLDLKDEIEANVSATGLSVGSAVVERLADSGDDPVYKSTLTGTLTLGSDSHASTIIVKHIPTATDNSTYHGKISFKMGTDSMDVMECEVGSGATFAGTILYEKSNSTLVKYLMNYASFCGSDTDPFDENNNILASDKYVAATNPDGWPHDWNFALFSMDPTQSGVGTYSYAWQAGSDDQRTRVFNLTTTADADGDVTGTAYYGFGPDVESASLGTIDGFVCNWASAGGARFTADRSAASLLAGGKGQSLAQRQEISRASSATVFDAATSNISYAISHSCNASINDNFTFQAIDENDNALNLSNDRTDDTPVLTNELINLADVVFTLPTAPSDI
jgi:hypothetical protein